MRLSVELSIFGEFAMDSFVGISGYFLNSFVGVAVVVAPSLDPELELILFLLFLFVFGYSSHSSSVIVSVGVVSSILSSRVGKKGDASDGPSDDISDATLALAVLADPWAFLRTRFLGGSFAESRTSFAV